MKRILLPLVQAVMLIIMSMFITNSSVLAQTGSAASEACAGIAAAGGTCDGNADGAKKQFNNIILTVIKIFSYVVGAVSVIMIIIGGFRYVISGGDSNGVSGAKNTIMYAIIGLVVVIFAQVIITFVYSSATTDSSSSSSSESGSKDSSESESGAPVEEVPAEE